MRSKLIIIINLVLVVANAGCAINQYRMVEATRVTPSKDESLAPRGIVEDAMQITPYSAFGEATLKKFESILNKEKDRKIIASKVYDLICTPDKRPRISPAMSIRYIFTKNPEGLPLDQVSKTRQDAIKLVRSYMQRWFYDESSNLEVAKGQWNSDFDNYRTAIKDTNGERTRVQRFSVLFPVLPSNKKNEIENYFSSVRFLPSTPDMESEPSSWHPSRHLIAIVFPKDGSVVMAPKVGDIFKATWGGVSYGTEMETNFFEDAYLADETMFSQDGFNMQTKAHYVASDNGWKLEENQKTVYPLHLAYDKILAYLKQEFTMVLPKAEVEKKLGVTDETYKQYFGYRLDTGKLSMELVAKHRDTIWMRYFYRNTNIAEASQPSGSILFRTSLDMSLACQTLIPVYEIESQ